MYATIIFLFGMMTGVAVSFIVTFIPGLISRYFSEQWEYGTCRGQRARRHRFERKVEFVLWRAGDRQGEHVYTEDFWHPMHPDHWDLFQAEPSRPAPKTPKKG